MKKLFLLTIAICIAYISRSLEAGLPPRAYTKAEMVRWTKVCEWLHASLPSTFKDYTIKQDNCGTFDWAEKNHQQQPLTVITKRNEPIGNQPNFNSWYTQNEDSVAIANNKILIIMKDMVKPDGTIDQSKMNLASAMQTKLSQCTTLSVHIRINVKVPLQKQYYIGTKPVKLSIPINAFAYLYTYPDNKILLDEEGESFGGTDSEAFFQDKALIIISTKPPLVKAPAAIGKANWQEDTIATQDNATEVSTATIKNIVVEISGAEEDVRAMIKQIDWKSLQSVMGK